MPHRRPTTGNEDSRVFEGGRRSLCGADDSVDLMADADGDDVRLVRSGLQMPPRVGHSSGLLRMT